MKVVVTGGAGFIGSNLAEELLKEHKVTVIDNLSTGRIENLDQIIDKINFIEGSITDLDLLKDAFSGSDTVFHEAAMPSVQRSVDNPIASNEANVEGTLKVLVAARDCNVRKLVYAASSSAYGDTPTLPKREEMKPNPKSPYAHIQAGRGVLLQSLLRGLRPEDRLPEVFQCLWTEAKSAVSIRGGYTQIYHQVLAHEPPVIYGDGETTRDFTFVKDVVKANILAMESPAEGVFNIACGERVSLNELGARLWISSASSSIRFMKSQGREISETLWQISHQPGRN